MFVQSLSVNSVARGTLLIFDLPRMLVKDIQQVEVNVIDSLLWARHSIFTSINQEKTKAREPNEVTICWWPPYDFPSIV
jgi:hypothetical protein